MGRHKVTIKKIEDATRSQITFSKRRNGLIKKIHELSTLCDVDVALVAFSPSGRVSQYPSDNKKFMKTLNRYVYLPILDRDYDVDDPKFHLNKLDHITDDGDKIIVVNREIKRYEQLKAVAELELHMNENKLRCFDKSLPKHATSLTEIRWQRKFLTDMLNQVRQRKEILIQGSLMNEDPPIGYLVDVDQKNLYNHLFVDGSQPNGLLVNGSEANGMLHGSSFSNNGKSSMVLSPKKSTGLRVNNYQVQRMDMPLGSKSSFLNNQCRSQVELSQDSKLMVGSAPTVLFTGNSSTDNNYNDNDGEQNQVFYNLIGMGMHADSFIQLYKDNKKKNKNVEKYQMNILNQELDNLVGMSLQGDSLLQLEKDSKNNNTTNGGDNQMNMLHGEYYNPICTCLHGKYFHNPTGTCLHVDAFRRTYMENNNNREKTPTIVRFMSSQVYCCNPMDTSSYVNPFLLCNNNKGKEKQMDMLSQEYARSNPRPQAYATKELDIRGSQIQNYEDVSNQDVILYNNQTSPENASDDLQHVDDDIGISKGTTTTLMNEASIPTFSDDFLLMDNELSFMQDLLNDSKISQLEITYVNEEASTKSLSIDLHQIDDDLSFLQETGNANRASTTIPSSHSFPTDDDLSFLQGLLIDPNTHQQDAAYVNEESETYFSNNLFQKSNELSLLKVLNDSDKRLT